MNLDSNPTEIRGIESRNHLVSNPNSNLRNKSGAKSRKSSGIRGGTRKKKEAMP